jgi:hypothetical protein
MLMIQANAKNNALKVPASFTLMTIAQKLKDASYLVMREEIYRKILNSSSFMIASKVSYCLMDN